ncbi:MAG: DUF2066 domain-containing protein [Porticoccaceae bacterium]
MKKSCLCVLLLSLFAACVAVTAQASDLHRAVVPVSDHSDKERNRALRQGLLEVLVKLSGSRDIGTRPGVQNLLNNAASYAVEFGYVQLAAGQGLGANFSPRDLDRFLRDNRLPIWPERRPLLLVWVATEPLDVARGFAGRDDNPALYAEVDKVFAARGLPVRYPLYDLADQLTLNIDDAWQLDAEKIAEASTRYGADAWLLLRCYETSSGTWRVAWMFSGGKNEAAVLENLDGEDLHTTVTTIGETVVDRIAAVHSYVPSRDTGQVALTVQGVHDFRSYTALVDVLSGLSMVRSLDVDSVASDSIQLRLGVEGDRKQLLDALSLVRQLRLPETMPRPGEVLTVNWAVAN